MTKWNRKMVNTYNYLQQFSTKLGENLEYLFIPVLLFFSPIGGILIAVAGVVALDTITGIWKAVKLGGWASVTSRGLSALISKLLLYEAVVLVTFLVGKHILGDILFKIFGIEMLLTKTLALTLISIEVKSIDENFRLVRGIGIYAALKLMVSRAGELKDDAQKLKKL